MKIEIKTKDLKNIVSKVGACVGDDALLPMTSYLGISIVDGALLLTGKDRSNTMTASLGVDTGGGSFNGVISAKTFLKLVAKITVPVVQLNFSKEKIQIRANGQYNFPLVYDEEGGAVVLEPVMSPALSKGKKLLGSTVKSIDLRDAYETTKAAVAKNFALGCFSAFFVSTEGVMTTDGTRVAFFKKTFLKNDALLPVSFMALLPHFVDETDVAIYETDTEIYVINDTLRLVGKKSVFGESFPKAEMLGVLNAAPEASVTVLKSAISAVLDRTNIFIGQTDKNALQLIFNDKILHIRDLCGKVDEELPISPSTIKEYKIILDNAGLKELLSAVNEENITFGLGNPDLLQIIFSGGVLLLGAKEETPSIVDEAKK